MNKPQRVPLRLTALEMLEPRMPLHGGPAPDMYFGDTGHDFMRSADIDRVREPASRAPHEMLSVSFNRPQPASRVTFFTEPVALSETYAALETPPPVQVLIVVTMPANATLTITPPAVSQVNSVVIAPPRSSTLNLRVTSPQLTPPSLQNTATRAPATVKSSSLDSLTSFSALFNASSVRSERAVASDADDGEANTAPTESTVKETASAERNSVRSGPTLQPTQQSPAETDDADELIDLNPEEQREKAKRKLPRTAPSTSLLSSAREELLRRQGSFNTSNLATEHFANSQQLEERESFTLPSNDDLIEALADDQFSARGAGSSSSFAEMARTQLEATLGLATDIELLDEAVSELAAAIAANSLTLGSLPAAEPK